MSLGLLRIIQILVHHKRKNPFCLNSKLHELLLCAPLFLFFLLFFSRSGIHQLSELSVLFIVFLRAYLLAIVLFQFAHCFELGHQLLVVTSALPWVSGFQIFRQRFKNFDGPKTGEKILSSFLGDEDIFEVSHKEGILFVFLKSPWTFISSVVLGVGVLVFFFGFVGFAMMRLLLKGFHSSIDINY